MSYNKIIRTVNAYYKLKTFNPELDIKNENLREELLNLNIGIYYDGFREHENTIKQVLENPEYYRLETLEAVLNQIDMYKHFDEVSSSKKTTEIKGFKQEEKEETEHLTIIGVNDEPKHKK